MAISKIKTRHASEGRSIAAVLRDTDVMVLSDEIYGGLTYGSAPHVSIASLPGMRERTVLVDGLVYANGGVYGQQADLCLQHRTQAHPGEGCDLLSHHPVV